MKAHDLPRNSVVAILYSTGAVSTFLHINKNGLINPFWPFASGINGFCLHGELDKHDPTEGYHEHWRKDIECYDVRMVQSHVTSADKVDFKLCRKFSKKHQ